MTSNVATERYVARCMTTGSVTSPRRLVVVVALVFMLISVAKLTRGHAIIRTTTVGDMPITLAVDHATHRAFVFSWVTSTVSVLDTRTGGMLRSVAVRTGSGQLAVDQNTDHVFVAALNYVQMLDAATGAVQRMTRVGGDVEGLAVDETRGHVFAGVFDVGAISMLDAQTGAVRQTIRAGGHPFILAVDARTARVFVVDGLDGTVRMIDTVSGKLLHTTSTMPRSTATPSNAYGRGLFAVADEPAGRVFVSAGVPDTVDVLDARTGRIVRRIRLPGAPRAAALDSATGFLFVTGSSRLGGAGYVSMLDGRNGVIKRTISLGSNPAAITVAPRLRRVFVTAVGALDAAGHIIGHGTVTILDASRGDARATINVGINPSAVTVDELTGHAFVVETNANPNGSRLQSTETWVTSVERRLHDHLPFFPSPPGPPARGSVSMLDASQ